MCDSQDILIFKIYICTQGPNGLQGPPGQPGADGRTVYNEKIVPINTFALITRGVKEKLGTEVLKA